MTKPFETRPGAHPTRNHERVYGRYEKLYTLNDFIAAAFFVAGSVMFFYSSLQTPATWFFVVGSISFMLRPTIKLIRELHLARIPLPGDDPALQNSQFIANESD